MNQEYVKSISPNHSLHRHQQCANVAWLAGDVVSDTHQGPTKTGALDEYQEQRMTQCISIKTKFQQPVARESSQVKSTVTVTTNDCSFHTEVQYTEE